MSDQRRVSQRKLAVLARSRLKEKVEREAAKKSSKRSVAASKFTEEVFVEIPEPCVDTRGAIVFSDEDRSHSRSVDRVSCEDTEAAKMAEMEAAEYDVKRVNIVKQVQVVDLAINDYTDEDVEPYDVVDGEHLRQLQRIHDKYDRAQYSLHTR